jgi:tyrosine-protein kinase
LPETVKILLEEGNANPQIRKNDDGYVPMHEAAARGHLDCVKVLSKNHVPLRPRTLDYKLPIHLALAANEAEMIRYFDSVKCRSPLSNRDDWYHGSLERKEALRSLQLCQNSYPNNDPATSYYLIRRHSQKNNLYVLTILFQGHTYNFEIEREEVGEVRKIIRIFQIF